MASIFRQSSIIQTIFLQWELGIYQLRMDLELRIQLGYEWAPAWVSWGSYNNYWGWAPLGPNIYVQNNSGWYAPDPWWTFVARDHFCSGNWNRYIYNRSVNVTHITHITNVYVNNNNYNNRDSWYYGPRVSDVERYSRNRVTTVKISESQRPERTNIRNNRMEVYRPTVENKRNEYRPAEYRTTSQARTGKRIEQTNARTNDPGVNRTREARTETRSTMQTSGQRSTNVIRETKAEPRNVAKKSEARVSNRIAEPKRETSARETRPNVTEGNRQKSNTTRLENAEKSQSRTHTPAVENRSNNPSRETRPNVTEGNRPISNTSRLENAEKSRSRSITPAVENRNTNSSRETGNNRTTNAQPSREQRTKDVTPSSNSRTQNTETQKSTKEDTKKAVRESRTEIKSSENRSSANPGRR